MKAILPLLFLAGCTTVVPVPQKFPEAPPELLKHCEQLLEVEAGKTAITDLLKTVVQNYTLYYQCSNKVDGWIIWHGEQKNISESVKK